MAANGDMLAAFAPVLEAVATMRTGDRPQKEAAHKYLSAFQKSVRKKCGVIFCRRITKSRLGGSLADNHRLATIRGRRGSKSVRCYNTQRQGMNIYVTV